MNFRIKRLQENNQILAINQKSKDVSFADWGAKSLTLKRKISNQFDSWEWNETLGKPKSINKFQSAYTP